MVSFKFRTSKTVNFATDVPSKHGFHLNDLNRICVYLHYYDNEINPFYVGQGSINRAFSFSRRNKLWKEKVIDITKVKVNIFKIDITIEESIKIEKELIDKYKRIENGGCLVNGNDGDTCIGKCNSENYFYNKHLFGENYEYIPDKTNNKIYIAISVANIDRKPVNIKILYGAEDLRINGFTPKNVSQVITGAKKSHAGYIFLDFFKLPKEEKEKYINLIDITTKI